MAEAWVYILHSQSLDKFYIGATRFPVLTRIEQHNLNHYPDSFSRSGIPWTLFAAFHCDSFRQAQRIEKHIKRMKSKVYIKNLKIYPLIFEQLKLKYH